jgi:2-iminobutanoate/2-iminopropanoate deaminase
MQRRTIDSTDAPQPAGGYAQAVEVSRATRVLHVSGQIPMAADGTVPETFAAQCHQAWSNLEAQLRAAGMTLDHVVKVTTYLADRCYGLEYRAIRNQILGDRKCALTVVIAGIFDAAWLLEVEAVAMA